MQMCEYNCRQAIVMHERFRVLGLLGLHDGSVAVAAQQLVWQPSTCASQDTASLALTVALLLCRSMAWTPARSSGLYRSTRP